MTTLTCECESSSTGVRQEKVRALRLQLAQGTYDVDGHLDTALALCLLRISAAQSHNAESRPMSRTPGAGMEERPKAASR